MDTPLPEVHLPGDLFLDLPGLWPPSVFVMTTWENKRGLLEFQVLPSTPCQSSASMAMERHPTVPEGVAYQLADCVASRRQRRCQIALSVTPLFRWDPSLWCR